MELFGEALQPRGQIYRFPYDRVLQAMLRADIAAGKVPGVNADADVDWRVLASAWKVAFSSSRRSSIFSAQRTAAQASCCLPWLSGTPNSTISPSPINLFRKPPSFVMTSSIALKYWFSHSSTCLEGLP